MAVHVPVMLEEVLEWLDPRPGQTFLDGTLGAGGHTRAIAERVAPEGRVLSLDRDPAAVERAPELLAKLPVLVCCSDYREFESVLLECGIDQLDGALLDLGLSSDQLNDDTRGFSFDSDGPLDLRFDPTQGRPASDFVNYLTQKELADLIFQYGEERCSRRIARRVVETRRQDPIRTAAQFARLVRGCVPNSPGQKIDKATRTFQALRIAANDELGALETALECLPRYLRHGAKLAIISFHSLEDRVVKRAFREHPDYVVLTKKPLVPMETELSCNPRSRSAKLRVAKRA